MRKLWLIILFVVCRQWLCAAVPPAGIEPDGINFWKNQWVFKNVFRHSAPWKPGTKDDVLLLDARGWVRELREGQTAYTYIFHKIDGRYPGGKYLCRYEGEGDLLFSGDARVVTQSAGRIELDVAPGDEGIRITLLFTNPENYIRNITLVHKEHADRFVEEPFHPRFLSLLQGFRIIRFSHLLQTVNNDNERWGDRAVPTDQTQGAPNGMAIEYALNLCNTLGVDAWFNIPHKADDDYVRNFARLVKNHLNEDLDVYIEYTHDAGFWMTPPSRHCRKMGIALNLSKTDNPKEAGARYYAQRSLEVFQLWKDVWDHADRLHCVLAKVDGYHDYRWLGAWKHADVYAFTHLIGDPYPLPEHAEKVLELGSEGVVTSLLASLESPLPEADQRLIGEVRRRGMEPVCFYLTQGLFADSRIEDRDTYHRVGAIMNEANRHPLMQDIYTRHIQRWIEAGGGAWIHPYFVQQASEYGNWGLLEHMQQLWTNAPKWQAVQTYLGTLKKDSLTSRRPTLTDNPKILIENDEAEKERNPMMGRVTAHLGARLDFDGYHQGEGSVKIEPVETPALSVWWNPHYLRGKPEHDYYVAHILKTPDKWRRFKTSFMPSTNGRVQISLSAASAQRYSGAGYGVDGTWPVVAWYDDITIKGATLKNGGFEDVRLREPNYWQRRKSWQGPRAVLERDSLRAAEGKHFVRTPTASSFNQYITDLKSDRPVELTFWSKVESVEKLFNVRIGVNAFFPNYRIGLNNIQIPYKAVFWRIDPVYHNWNMPQRLEASHFRKALLAKAGEEWTEQSISFTPDISKPVDIYLHGVRIKGDSYFEPRWVEYDDIRVTGAVLANGDFEDNAAGLPESWVRFGEDNESDILIHDPAEASSGEYYIRTWYQSGLRARLLSVQKGQPISIIFKARSTRLQLNPVLEADVELYQ